MSHIRKFCATLKFTFNDAQHIFRTNNYIENAKQLCTLHQYQGGKISKNSPNNRNYKVYDLMEVLLFFKYD